MSLQFYSKQKDTCARKTRVYGSRGQLEWDDASSNQVIEHYDFLSGQTYHIDYKDAIPQIAKEKEQKKENKNIKLTGHGGSDYFLMDSFVEAVLRSDKSLVPTNVDDSFRSHLIVFAAEHARRTNSVVDIDEFSRINNIPIWIF